MKKKKVYDFMLGDFQYLTGNDGSVALLVKALHFVCWGITAPRVDDLKKQWELSDHRYDYVVSEGTPDELILFQQREDLEKFQFFTFLTPTTANYRLVNKKDKQNYNL